jgi:hypothetical protein
MVEHGDEIRSDCQVLTGRRVKSATSFILCDFPFSTHDILRYMLLLTVSLPYCGEGDQSFSRRSYSIHGFLVWQRCEISFVKMLIVMLEVRGYDV